MDEDRLAAALAECFAAVVPFGFSVEASHGMLWYSTARRGSRSIGLAGTHVRGNFEVFGPNAEENIAGIAVQALSELQDYLSEATGDPWPGQRRQPAPSARIRDGRLYLGYEDSGEVVLALPPIDLADLP